MHVNEHGMLAILVRREGESVAKLQQRLDDQEIVGNASVGRRPTPTGRTPVTAIGSAEVQGRWRRRYCHDGLVHNLSGAAGRWTHDELQRQRQQFASDDLLWIVTT